MAAARQPGRVAGLVAGLLALLVYGLTLAPDLTWANFSGDGGELIAAAVTLGVPHPPGYPTYVLLGKLVSYLPLGTVAFRFNLFSAVCLATAVGLVAAAAHRRAPWPTAVAAALLFGFTPLVWGQALVAEVYALNLAVVAGLIWALAAKRPSFLAGLLLGLSLTTHLSSLLLIPLAASLTPPPRWPRLAAGALVGLTPFLALFWLAGTAGPVRWGEPGTLTGWWWLVSGALYRSNVFNLVQRPFDLAARFQEWTPILIRQLIFLGLPLALIRDASPQRYTGVEGAEKSHVDATSMANSRSLPHTASDKPAHLSDQSTQANYPIPATQYPISALPFLATAALYLLYALTYSSDDAVVYTLPAWLLLSLPLASALPRLNGWILLLPLLSVSLHFSGQSLRDDVAVRQSAELLFQSAPPAAILLTEGDPSLFSLWYFQAVEGRRPDLLVVDQHLLGFDWYRAWLQQRQPTLVRLMHDEPDLFITDNRQHRPVCRVDAVLRLMACESN